MITKLEYSLGRCYSFFLIAAMLVLSFGLASAQSVYLSNVTGAIGIADTLRTNVPIIWTLNMKVVDDLSATNNGFRLYSPDGATWSIPVIDTAAGADWRSWGGLNIFIYYAASVSGSGSDTIGIGGFRLLGHGFRAGYDEPSILITTQLSDADSNKTICLDSTFYDVNSWLWSTVVGSVVPSWSGPHCYKIFPCCIGSRGDANGDGSNSNILDLTFYVDYIFRDSGKPGTCPEESDINGDGTPSNILDLTFIVDRLFRGGPAPGPCN